MVVRLPKVNVVGQQREHNRQGVGRVTAEYDNKHPGVSDAIPTNQGTPPARGGRELNHG